MALLFGFLAIARGKNGAIDIPSTARLAFYFALGAFAVAGVLALIVNVPRKYRGATVRGLERLAVDHRTDSPQYARRRVARTRVELYGSYRKANQSKARFLIAAVGAEVVAVFALGIAIGLVVAAS